MPGPPDSPEFSANLDVDLENFSADTDLGASEPIATQYPTVGAWVDQWLLIVYRRPVRGRQLTWCPEWWQHPEAKLRLTALWQTWEAMRLEPPFGMADWLRVHLDHHMPILLSADGPFKGCSPDAHSQRPVEKLPSSPDPTELNAAGDLVGDVPTAT